MSLIVTMRQQKAVWWKRLTPNEEGEFTYDAPVEIDCRWEDVAQEFMNSKGQKEMSKATVYVDRLMEVGDRLKEGAIDSNTTVSPLTDNDAFEIQRFDKMPNRRNTETLLTAILGGHASYATS